MVDKPNFEVPPELREIAARSVAEARKAVDRMMDATRQAVDTAHAQAEGLRQKSAEGSTRTLGFAQDQVNAAFDFAERLAGAGSIAEMARLQTEFVKSQSEKLGHAAQEARDAGGRFFNETMKPQG